MDCLLIADCTKQVLVDKIPANTTKHSIFLRSFTAGSAGNHIIPINKTKCDPGYLLYVDLMSTSANLYSSVTNETFDLVWDTSDFIYPAWNSSADHYMFNVRLKVENQFYENTITFSQVYSVYENYTLQANITDIVYTSTRLLQVIPGKYLIFIKSQGNYLILNRNKFI
jgi:hypothetical protein